MKNIFLVMILSMILLSCTSLGTERSVISTPTYDISPLPRPTLTKTPLPVSTLQADKAGFQGQILVREEWQSRDVLVYASPFYPTEDENQGFYVLEPSIHPRTQLASSGDFNLMNVDPGAYVLVVGPNPDEAVTIQDSEGTKVYRVAPNEVLDIGKVNLR